MKRFIFFLIMASFFTAAYPQFKLEVASFEEDTSDISARSRAVNDLNGDPTAFLKIQIPMLQNAVIESPLKVKDGEYKPGEFLVYLGHGTKRVTIKHQDFEPLEYRFDKPLQGKSVYKLVLKIPENYLSNGQMSAKISTNVNNASIEINGQRISTDDGEFIVRLKEGEYPFTIIPNSTGFNQLQGVLTISDEDIKNEGRIDRYYELESYKKANLHILAHQNSEITIDGKQIKDWGKHAIVLPLGRHIAKVKLDDFNEEYVLNLVEGENTFNADIRGVLTIRSPKNGEFSITPLGNALKPTQSKIKAGQPVKLLGSYKIEAKNKGYDTKIENITFNAGSDSVFLSIPMVSIANKVFNGYGNKKADPKKGEKEYRKLISEGDDVAMWEFGNILIKENLGSRVAQGEEFIRRAAANGNPEACIYMSQFVDNPTDRRNYLRNAIKGGSVKAHTYLGDSYLNDSPVDYGKAFSEYSLSTDSRSKIGRAKAMLASSGKISSDIDIHGLLETIDPSDPYYGKSLDARGNLYANGIGVNQDYRKAAELWKEAGIGNLENGTLLKMAVINSGSSDDAYSYLKNVNLAGYQSDMVILNGKSLTSVLRSVGQAIGNRKDCYHDSFRFFSKAYDLGDRSLNTLLFLGKFLKDGQGTQKDPESAKKILMMAATEHKDKSALRWLGNIFEEGKDTEMAMKYYQEAIKLGDNDSKGYYGAILVNRKDRKNGEKYLTEAANGGHKQSMRNLVKYYEKIAPDSTKANYWKMKLNEKSK